MRSREPRHAPGGWTAIVAALVVAVSGCGVFESRPAPTASATPAGSVAAASPAAPAGPTALATGQTAAPAASPTPAPTRAPSPLLSQGPFADRAKGMSHEVIAFLNYFDVDRVVKTLDYGPISTIAFFSIPLDRRGRLKKNGAEWASWTGPSMGTLIERAHAAGTKVVLSAERFAWSGGQAAVARALLSSSAARQRAADEIADAVEERGVDGVNIDFEPIPNGQKQNFVRFVRLVRRALDAKRPGYQLTYDATGLIGNYDVKALAQPGAADAVYIMGYHYRGQWSKQAGSVAPLGGPAYDYTDTLREFLKHTTRNKIVFGVPLYGWRWQTAGPGVRSATGGASGPLFYADAVREAGRRRMRYDRVEQVAWTAYRSGGKWWQIYFDDRRALEAKWNWIIRQRLRGTGLWALGFEGPRHKEIYALLRKKFVRNR